MNINLNFSLLLKKKTNTKSVDKAARKNKEKLILGFRKKIKIS